MRNPVARWFADPLTDKPYSYMTLLVKRTEFYWTEQVSAQKQADGRGALALIPAVYSIAESLDRKMCRRTF